MKENKDLFAPPSEKELSSSLFAPPSSEELDLEKSFLQNLVEGGSDLGVGLAQGATFNLSDEGLAGLKALSNVATTDSTMDDLSRLYDEYKKIEQERIDLAKERSPIATTVGNVGGAVATGALTGGIGSGVLGGASLAGRVAGLAGLGATEGGLAAYGADEDVLQGAGLGGLTGGIVGGAFGIIPKVGRKIVDSSIDSNMDYLRGAGYGAKTGKSLTEDIQENIVPRKKETIKEFTDAILSPAKKIGTELNEAYKQSDMLDLSNEISEIVTKRAQLTRGKENLLNDPANTQLENIFNKYFPGLDDIDFSQVDNPDELSKFISSSNISVEQAKNLINDLESFGGDNALYRDLASGFAKTVKDKLPEDIKALKEQFSKVAKIPEQVTPSVQSGTKSLSDLGGVEKARDVLNEKLRKDVYSLAEKSSKKSSDLMKEQYDNLIELTKNSDILSDEQKAKVIKNFENLKSTAKDVRYLGESTRNTTLSDASPKTLALRGADLIGPKGFFRLSEGVGKMFNKADKAVGTLTKPIEQIGQVGSKFSNLFKKTPSELSEIGKQVGGSLGETLSNAADVGDIAKANAALFSIIQSPILRGRLREAGYEE